MGVLLIALASGPVLAGQESGATFGLGAAWNGYDLNPGELGGISGSDHAFGWEAFGGWRFNRFIAVEASYLNGGHIDIGFTNANLRLSGRAYGASAVGSFPIGDTGLALFGRAGYMRGDLKLEASGPGGKASETIHDSQPILGAGIRARVDGAQLRLEYDRIDWDDFDSERISLNVAWLF
jgi:hypothetical protein